MGKLKYPIIDGKKQCGKCLEWKSIENYNKTRTYFCPSCRDCLSKHAKEYRQLPEVKVRARQYVKNYRKIESNKEKINERARKFTKSPETKKKRNERRKQYTAKLKLEAVQYKGGKCIYCGYSDCLAALDFHHRNPSEKQGAGIVSHWSFDKNKSELDKCDLVCVRCHREIHAGFKKQ